MKKILLTIFWFFITASVFAQFPSYFNYQAVARDQNGMPLKNTQIAVEVSILQGDDCINSTNCNLLWQEIHFPTTNEFGIFNIEIGNGQNTFAGSLPSFDNIDWENLDNGNYFMKIRVDFGSSQLGNSMEDLGVVKFLSVPYSLASENVARDANGKLPFRLSELLDVNINDTTLTANQVLSWNGSQWVNVASAGGSVLALNDLTDVSINSQTASQVLFFDGNNWVNSFLSLNDLSDVSASALNGQVLIFDGTNWISDSLALTNLKDINLSNLNDGDVLTWQSGQWINQASAAGGSLWTATGSDIYYNNGKVGIGTDAPAYLFHTELGSTNYFVVSGTADAASAAPSWNAGVYMAFNPARVSLLMGEISGTQWNTAGTYSFTFGKDNSPNGVYSVVFGQSNVADGDFSFVGGLLSSSSGVRTFAYGEGLEAISYLSAVFGRYNYSTGQNPSTWYDANQLFVLGNGSDASNRHNAMVVTKGGDLKIQGTLSEADPNPTKTFLQKNYVDNFFKLQPLQYDTQKGVVFGFSYENVKQLYPGLVFDFNENEHTIAYTRLIPIMVEIIKQQNEKINDLEKRVEKLEQQLQNK